MRLTIKSKIIMILILFCLVNIAFAGDIKNNYEKENGEGAKHSKKLAQLRMDSMQLSNELSASRSDKVKVNELTDKLLKLNQEMALEQFAVVQAMSITPKQYLEKNEYLTHVHNLALLCSGKTEGPQCESTLVKALATIQAYWGNDKDIFAAQSERSIGDYFSFKKDYKKALASYRSAYDAYALIPCSTSHVWIIASSLNMLRRLNDDTGQKPYLDIVKWCELNNKMEVKGTTITLDPTKNEYAVITPKIETQQKSVQPAPVKQAIPQRKEIVAKNMSDFINQTRELVQDVMGGDDELTKKIDLEMRKTADAQMIKQLDSAKLMRADKEKKAEQEFAQLMAKDQSLRKKHLMQARKYLEERKII